jgi:hypothetical protein
VSGNPVFVFLDVNLQGLNCADVGSTTRQVRLGRDVSAAEIMTERGYRVTARTA